jgi:HTH-type transcriptional regulator/antitoxin HipB
LPWVAVLKTLSELSDHLRERRRGLALSQKDMLMKIGMFQQQYQRIESGKDTRVSTLLRVLEGMGLELMLVPREQVQYIDKILKSGDDIGEFLSGETKKMDETGTSSWSVALKDLED